MKYKYTFLKNRLFYDEILIPYLDKMSKKGWNLVSVNSFFKFEKSSQVYKYQVDYNPLTDDYLETLDHLGYEHVCCMQDMHIYRNVNTMGNCYVHSCGYDLLWFYKFLFLVVPFFLGFDIFKFRCLF